MRLLHTSVVGADETDSLGHLNVNHYIRRAELANAALAPELGLDAEALEAAGQSLRRIDSYCKYNREQFPDAILEVRGGVIDAADDGLRMFYEVRNPAQDTHAATFILEYALFDRASGARLPLPDATLRGAEDVRTKLPTHGEPRSIRLVPPRTDIALDRIRERVGDGGLAMMGGLRERRIEPEVCDAFGFLRLGEDMVFGPRQRAQMDAEGRPHGPEVSVAPDGRRFGWAWMETRHLILETPRQGDLLRSIAADLAHGAKTRHSRRWIFNATTGRLAATDDMIGLCLDLDARRAIDTPPDVRAELGRVYAPELA
jgi:acyl-CoA thioester hydrolase